jgi:hypothetical protein
MYNNSVGCKMYNSALAAYFNAFLAFHPLTPCFESVAALDQCRVKNIQELRLPPHYPKIKNPRKFISVEDRASPSQVSRYIADIAATGSANVWLYAGGQRHLASAGKWDYYVDAADLNINRAPRLNAAGIYRRQHGLLGTKLKYANNVAAHETGHALSFLFKKGGAFSALIKDAVDKDSAQITLEKLKSFEDKISLISTSSQANFWNTYDWNSFKNLFNEGKLVSNFMTKDSLKILVYHLKFYDAPDTTGIKDFIKDAFPNIYAVSQKYGEYLIQDYESALSDSKDFIEAVEEDLKWIRILRNNNKSSFPENYDLSHYTTKADGGEHDNAYDARGELWAEIFACVRTKQRGPGTLAFYFPKTTEYVQAFSDALNIHWDIIEAQTPPKGQQKITINHTLGKLAPPAISQMQHIPVPVRALP